MGEHNAPRVIPATPAGKSVDQLAGRLAPGLYDSIDVLLPMLSVIVVAEGSQAEQAWSDGVRVRASAGWEVVDSSAEKAGHGFTVVSGDRSERHVFDGARYTVDPKSTLPANLEPPDGDLAAAITAPNGAIELFHGCGESFPRGYWIDAHAEREFAPRFVAFMLATADDVRWAWVVNQHAYFNIERGDQLVSLVVWLDPSGRPIEAQIQNRRDTTDGVASYKRLHALRRSLARESVFRIVSGSTGVVLTTKRATFAIDPDQDAFLSGARAYQSDGCGC